MSSIALRQHTFDVGPFTFAHNFLVLYDGEGNVVAELHGLATDPVTGAIRPIGRSSDYLRAFEFPGKRYWNEGQSEKTLWEGPDGAMERWQAAKDAYNQINSRNLTYNPWGSDSQGELHDWVGWDRWPKEQISSGYARFSAANWDAQAADYLRTLGMTCRPEQPSAEGKVLCSIELPVWVECTSMNIYFPGVLRFLKS